jgi:prepilin-type N-terminal cleavage/methylation domain-containing protein
MIVSRTHKGFSMVEILIAAAILVSVVVVVSASLQVFVRLSSQTAQTIHATLLLEEAAEALQLLRDSNWDTNIAPRTLDTPYYLSWNGSAYAISDTPVIIGGDYRREVVFSQVRRDAQGVLDAGGDPDNESRKVTITIYRNSDDVILTSAEALVHNLYD